MNNEKRVKILVVDGQGGKLGRQIIASIKEKFSNVHITAVGTNSIATSNMIKAKVDVAVTGENAIIHNSRIADIIVGPVGIVVADSFYGESCAGAWRYLLGDVIKFTSKAESEIVITGRTKHFLSLCGEHLSVDNMNKAVEMVEEQLNLSIREFTVTGVPYGSLFAHHWYIGTEDPVDPGLLKSKIDDNLKSLNDDYLTERRHALKEIRLTVISSKFFYEWMKEEGKEGGQHKFPRVLKGQKALDWKKFLKRIGELS